MGTAPCRTISAQMDPAGLPHPAGPVDLRPLFTFALCPTGLGSSHFVVRMVASLCIIWGTFPVCRISTSVDLPCRGGPTTIIFISLHFSARRSCARKYASTVLGPARERRGWGLQAQTLPGTAHTPHTAAHTAAPSLLPLQARCELRTKNPPAGKPETETPRKGHCLGGSAMEHCKEKQMLGSYASEAERKCKILI